MAKKNKKETLKTNGASTAGTTTRAGSVAPPDNAPPPTVTKLPPVVGINFGNSYASIAVFTKEGQAECIANEDGERQIACAISFNGEETYIGNQAKSQLVKNSKNTIIGFRNLLGQKYSDISQSTPPSVASAPVIQHPTLPDTPAYSVQVISPSPAPLPSSAQPTPGTTPRTQDPTPTTRILTPAEVTGLFLKSLITSASNFLGVAIQGCVISVPEWFSPAARAALSSAAKEYADVEVLQLLEEAGAVVGVTTLPSWGTDLTPGAAAAVGELKPDRTQLVVDLGSSSLSLTLLSIRQGLAYILASSTSPKINATQIDDKLIKFFATEFTKKTKVPLTVCPSPSGSIPDQRAEAKLRLAIEHTKRTLSASSGAATCSVESLKDGVDFTGSVNRMRFDMLVSPIYASVATAIIDLFSSTSNEGSGNPPIDAHEIDEIVYVGGTSALPGLDERILVSIGCREDVQTPFARSSTSTDPSNATTVSLASGGISDPTTLVARGCAVQASLLWGLPLDAPQEAELRQAFGEGGHGSVTALQKALGVLFPGNVPVKDGEEYLGGLWVPVVPKESALPVRRSVELDLEVASEGSKVFLEVWEVDEGIRVEKIKVDPGDRDDDDDDDEEEEEEEEEIKHKVIRKRTLLSTVQFVPKLASVHSGPSSASKGKSKATSEAISPSATLSKRVKGHKYTRVEVSIVVGIDGAVEGVVREVGEGEKVAFAVSAPGSGL